MYTDLAAIISYTDWLRFNKVVARKALTAAVWVGLYNDINGWRWLLNDLPLKNITYSNWYPGEPNNAYGHKSCVIIIGYGYWADATCTDLRPFICYNGKSVSLNDLLNFIVMSYNLYIFGLVNYFLSRQVLTEV